MSDQNATKVAEAPRPAPGPEIKTNAAPTTPDDAAKNQGPATARATVATGNTQGADAALNNLASSGIPSEGGAASGLIADTRGAPSLTQTENDLAAAGTSDVDEAIRNELGTGDDRAGNDNETKLNAEQRSARRRELVNQLVDLEQGTIRSDELRTKATADTFFDPQRPGRFPHVDTSVASQQIRNELARSAFQEFQEAYPDSYQRKMDLWGRYANGENLSAAETAEVREIFDVFSKEHPEAWAIQTNVSFWQKDRFGNALSGDQQIEGPSERTGATTKPAEDQKTDTGEDSLLPEITPENIGNESDISLLMLASDTGDASRRDAATKVLQTRYPGLDPNQLYKEIVTASADRSAMDHLTTVDPGDPRHRPLYEAIIKHYTGPGTARVGADGRLKILLPGHRTQENDATDIDNELERIKGDTTLSDPEKEELSAGLQLLKLIITLILKSLTKKSA